MKLLFFVDYIKGNEILFWSFVVSIVTMIILSIIFVGGETKNEHK